MAKARRNTDKSKEPKQSTEKWKKELSTSSKNPTEKST